MKKYIFIVALIALSTSSANALNYDLYGLSSDGWTIVYNSDPPATVNVFKTLKDGSRANDIEYESVGCEFFGTKNASFTCPESGKSPLAGTTYIFKKRFGGNCMMEVPEVPYDLYVCTTGCNKNKRTPKTLMLGGNCL
jgi:hypothetical protein